MHKMFYTQNIQYVPPVTNYFLAGTSPDGKILKSIDDGLNWIDEDTLGKGNPTCINFINSSNIWYGTSTGYICNYIGESFIKVSNYQINSIYTNIPNDMALLGDSNGDCYYTPISDFDGWSLQYSLGYSINYIQYDLTVGTLMFTSNGIYTHNGVTLTLRQSGNFICAVYDSVNGFIYAETTTGYIYRNTTTNDYTTWSNVNSLPGSPIKQICKNGNRMFVTTGSQYVFYTDDNWSSLDVFTLPVSGSNSISNNGDVIIIGTTEGHIVRSTNNGSSWTDLGQQYSQTSINCLLSV